MRSIAVPNDDEFAVADVLFVTGTDGRVGDVATRKSWTQSQQLHPMSAARRDGEHFHTVTFCLIQLNEALTIWNRGGFTLEER